MQTTTNLPQETPVLTKMETQQVEHYRQRAAQTPDYGESKSLTRNVRKLVKMLNTAIIVPW